jgi:3-hydroxymyristoyl/3-hydroxydecanoyl-(acyl carrier protein) dehydratase
MTASSGRAAEIEPEIRALHPAETGIEIELTPRRSLLYYDGHFPNFAILPGVVQVDWALRFARRHLGFGPAPPRTLQVKFRRPILPETPITLSLSSTRSGQRLAFTYRDARGVCSSGQLGF